MSAFLEEVIRLLGLGARYAQEQSDGCLQNPPGNPKNKETPMRIKENPFKGTASKIAALFSPAPVVRHDLARISDEIADEAVKNLPRKH